MLIAFLGLKNRDNHIEKRVFSCWVVVDVANKLVYDFSFSVLLISLPHGG
ncbi:MAG: hypothetical protein QG610_1309 [Euryarchaeota archaeon]|nr:hypothetical protein [Euryarchaeota archaeon]